MPHRTRVKHSKAGSEGTAVGETTLVTEDDFKAEGEGFAWWSKKTKSVVLDRRRRQECLDNLLPARDAFYGEG